MTRRGRGTEQCFAVRVGLERATRCAVASLSGFCTGTVFNRLLAGETDDEPRFRWPRGSSPISALAGVPPEKTAATWKRAEEIAALVRRPTRETARRSPCKRTARESQDNGLEAASSNTARRRAGRPLENRLRTAAAIGRGWGVCESLELGARMNAAGPTGKSRSPVFGARGPASCSPFEAFVLGLRPRIGNEGTPRHSRGVVALAPAQKKGHRAGGALGDPFLGA